MLFVSVLAEFSNDQYSINQACIWDDVIMNREDAVFNFKNKKAEYPIHDLKDSLKGNAVNLTLQYEIVPWTGFFQQDRKVVAVLLNRSLKMLYPSEAINFLNISCEPSEIRNFCNGQFPKPTLNSCAQSMSLSSIYLLASITSLGGFTFGYDTGIMNGLLASPTFHSQMGITLENMSDRKGSIAAALQAGGLLGAVIQPLITDWLGRKVSILYMCVLFSIGVIFQTLATSLEMMLVGRFIAGIGVSIMAVAVSMYNTEMAPSAVRGRIVGMQQLMVGVGSASAYWINYFLRMVEGSAQVTIPLALQVVPAVFLFIGLLFMPQSPRWLASRNRIIEARVSLSRIRQLPIDSSTLNDEMLDITLSLDHSQSPSWSEIFTTANIHRLSIGLPFTLFQQFLGQNLINYYSPALFQSLGLDSNGTDLLATGVIGLVRIIMTVPALIAVDRYGRRPLMLTGTILMSISFYYIGYYTTLGKSAIGIQGYLAIGLVYIFMSGYAISWSIVHYVLPSEIYPTRVRAKNNSLGAVVDWGFQIVSIKVYAYTEGGGVILATAGFLTLLVLWIWHYLPETRGLSIEEMDEVFAKRRALRT